MTKWLFLLFLLFLLFANTVHCEPLVLPVTLNVAGQAADWASSLSFGPGTRCLEANPLLRRPDGSFNVARGAVLKGGVVLGVTFAARWLDRSGHPRMGRMLAYGSGGVGFLAATINVRACR